jgi:TP901 family phage tail tape measure protein
MAGGTSRMLTIALMLTAVDQMSNVVESATNKINSAMKDIKDGYSDILQGVAGIYSAKLLYDKTVKPVEDAFKHVQDAGNELKQSMLTTGNHIDEGFFSLLSERAEKLSVLTGQTQDSYLHMFQLMKSNGFGEKDMLGNVGTELAKWFKIMNTGPEEGTLFASGLKNDFSLANDEIIRMLDLVRRLHYYGGVGTTGADAIGKLRETFSLSALGLSSQQYAPDVSHIDDATSLAALAGIFHRRQLEGTAVGTAFRKIFTNILDNDKENQTALLAKQHNIDLAFRNEKGEWLGVANMQAQFEKLKVLNKDIQAEILKPIAGGKGGVATNILSVLEEFGKTGLQSQIDMLYNGGKEADAFALSMSSLSSKQAVAEQQWQNAKVIMGAQLLPILLKMTAVLSQAAHWFGEFSRHHPSIVRMVFSLIGLVASIMALRGAFLILKGSGLLLSGGLKLIITGLSRLPFIIGMVVDAIELFGIGIAAVSELLLTTPIGWIIAAIVALILVFKNWGSITKWFSKTFEVLGDAMLHTWNSIKQYTVDFFQWLWRMFTQYNLFGLIIANWGKIVAWVVDMWNNVTKKFSEFLAWMVGLGLRFYNAGKNIIGNIFLGIKSMINKPIDAIKNMVQKIRNMLPFSPAKEGPLRDIHKIRLIETIAENIKPNAILDKMRAVSTAIFQYAPLSGSATSANSVAGAGVHLVFAPVYNGKNGAGYASDRQAWMDDARKNAKDLVRMLDDEALRRGMKSF